VIKAGVELFLLYTSPHMHAHTHTHNTHTTHTQHTRIAFRRCGAFAIDLQIIKEEMSESGMQYFRSHSFSSHSLLPPSDLSAYRTCYSTN